MAINSPEGARAYGNLASALDDLGQLERSYAMIAEARRLAERLGLDDWLRWLRAESAWHPYYAGRWDDATRILDELIREFAESPFWMETPCRWLQGRMRLARGDTKGAREDAERAIDLARVAKDPQVLWPPLCFAARVLYPADPERADDLVGQVLSEWEAQGWPATSESDWMLDAAFVLPLVGRGAQFLEGASHVKRPWPWRKAAVAYVSGDPLAAAEILAGIGARPAEAYARLRAAETLVREGRRAEANVELEGALAFWRSVGATAHVREAEALLAASA